MHRLLLELPSKLETDRLIIRSYQKGDGKSLFLMIEKNREHFKETVDYATTVKKEEDAEIKIRELAVDWMARKRFVMGIWQKLSHEFTGQIWIEPKKWDVPSFEIGWFLGEEYEGRGIATEAVKASLAFLFKDLHAHKVIVYTRENNAKSRRLTERCGFVREGLLRDNAKIGDNKWIGLLCYGMLKEEYENLRNNWIEEKKR